MLKKNARSIPLCSTRLISFSVPRLPSRCFSGRQVCACHTLSVSTQPRRVLQRCQAAGRWGSPPVSPCRALRVRKKMSGEKMPVKMIGDILSAQLPHMQPYIRFCSCQLNGAALIQQKTDEAPDFKEFVKVRSPRFGGTLSEWRSLGSRVGEALSKVGKGLSAKSLPGLKSWPRNKGLALAAKSGCRQGGGL